LKNILFFVDNNDIDFFEKFILLNNSIKYEIYFLFIENNKNFEINFEMQNYKNIKLKNQNYNKKEKNFYCFENLDFFAKYKKIFFLNFNINFYINENNLSIIRYLLQKIFILESCNINLYISSDILNKESFLKFTENLLKFKDNLFNFFYETNNFSDTEFYNEEKNDIFEISHEFNFYDIQNNFFSKNYFFYNNKIFNLINQKFIFSKLDIIKNFL
jgi:hypothetical protein